MRVAITILALLLYLPLILYYMSMFQQNSYRPQRFLRWLKSNPFPRLFRKSKVRFVFTSRMVRLFIVEIIVFAICTISIWSAWGCVLLCPFVLLFSNLVTTPVEKAINKWYYKDAERILKKHDNLVIIGVTGSYGKTSTKNYLYRILSEKYNVLMTPGNYNTTLGVVRTIRECLEPYHQVFIVEMGAKQKGDIKEICDLVHPSIGIVSAVGQMHLETFGSFENIQKTKFELIDSLPLDGYGVINAESEGIASYNGIPNHCKIDSYGIDAHRCSSRAANSTYTISGMEFDFITHYSSVHYKTHLLGENNILNLCAALLVAEYLGVDAEKRVRAVSKLQPVEHRLSMSKKSGLIVLDDAYNSNPEGAAMALGVLRSFPIPDGAHKIVITPGFVEMGAVQYDNCKKLGELASHSADVLVVVNKVNRAAILEGVKSAGMDKTKVICADTLLDALVLVRPFFTEGSVVLYENDLPDMFV